MNLLKEDIKKASQEIGITEDQGENLWRALQKIQANRSMRTFSNALLYVGATIAFLSMTWFYTATIGSLSSLLISILYALIFFGNGFYFWYVEKLKAPAGVLSSLGIIMVPLIVYSLQTVMNWWPTSSPNDYASFYRLLNGSWVPAEVSTLAIGCLVLYFIRLPFITVWIYLILTFMTVDGTSRFFDPMITSWSYHYTALTMLGTLLIILGSILSRKGEKDFAFWTYLFGMFLCWIGLTDWTIFSMQSQLGHFIYFLIHVGFIFVSSFFHQKIFTVFGSLGIICYISQLSYFFSDSLLFSYILGGIGFAIVLAAALLIRLKKFSTVNYQTPFRN